MYTQLIFLIRKKFELLLDTSNSSLGDPLNFRGLSVYNNQLYVANSSKTNSYIANWLNQQENNNQQLPFQTIVCTANQNPGLQHPYDIFLASIHATNIYVSICTTK